MSLSVFKELKDQIQNAQNRMSWKKSNCIYETYKNKVMPPGCHIYTKVYGMAKATIYTYPQLYHALPHWKCDMQCCAKFPSVNLPDQETDYQNFDTIHSI